MASPSRMFDHGAGRALATARRSVSVRRSSSRFDLRRSIADEAREAVRQAAVPVEPGETIKAQMRRAWMKLGLPFWRIRAAWHGAAGCWSAEALEELRVRSSRLSSLKSQAEEAVARDAYHSVLARLADVEALLAESHARLDRAAAPGQR